MPPAFRVSVFKKHGSDDDSEEAELNGKELFEIMAFYRKKSILIFGFVCSLLAGAAPFLMNVIMGDMLTLMTSIQTITDGSFMSKMMDILLNMIYVIIAMSALQCVGIWSRTCVNPYFMSDLRELVFKTLLQLDISFFDATPTGVLVARLSEDVTLVRETYIDKGLQFVQSLTQALVGVVLGLCVFWRVALCCFPAVPLSALVWYLGDWGVDRLWQEYHKVSKGNESQAEEVINQFRTVKAFDQELWEAERYNEGLKGVHDVECKASWFHAIKDGMIFFFLWGTMAILQYMTIYFIVRKPYFSLESGDMIILQMSAMQSVMGVSQALGMIADFGKAAISARKLLTLIAKRPKVQRDEGEDRINGRDKVQGRIEFIDVGFRYKTREEWAVRHLNITVEAGQTVAIVGESGSGKSTTLQLLQRFYEIEEGEILIDGVDIRRLKPSFVRRQVASVPQNPVLFTMSILDNIRYARPDASDEEVARAATVGNAHNFVMELPGQYRTMVQQTALSGGQKQRVCIARAIMQDSPILILDEATAALDTESEQLVQESLEVVRHGKTAIAVAHRLATVMHADKIFVMHQGMVIEEGRHSEMLAAGGHYADLVKYQLQ